LLACAEKWPPVLKSGCRGRSVGPPPAFVCQPQWPESLPVAVPMTPCQTAQ